MSQEGTELSQRGWEQLVCKPRKTGGWVASNKPWGCSSGSG